MPRVSVINRATERIFQNLLLTPTTNRNLRHIAITAPPLRAARCVSERNFRFPYPPLFFTPRTLPCSHTTRFPFAKQPCGFAEHSAKKLQKTSCKIIFCMPFETLPLRWILPQTVAFTHLLPCIFRKKRHNEGNLICLKTF